MGASVADNGDGTMTLYVIGQQPGTIGRETPSADIVAFMERARHEPSLWRQMLETGGISFAIGAGVEAGAGIAAAALVGIFSLFSS